MGSDGAMRADGKARSQMTTGAKMNRAFNRFDADQRNDVPAWVEHVPLRGGTNGQEEFARRELIRRKVDAIHDARNLGHELSEVWESEG